MESLITFTIFKCTLGEIIQTIQLIHLLHFYLLLESLNPYEFWTPQTLDTRPYHLTHNVKVNLLISCGQI